MAMWKRLHRTGPEGNEIDVNMDAAVHMERFEDATTIHFCGKERQRSCSTRSGDARRDSRFNCAVARARRA
jgi:hypothetical protein